MGKGGKRKRTRERGVERGGEGFKRGQRSVGTKD